MIELPDVSRVSPIGFSTVVSLPTSGQNGSAVRINGGTLIEQDSLSSNSKDENGNGGVNDSRGFNFYIFPSIYIINIYTFSLVFLEIYMCETSCKRIFFIY